MNAVLLVACIVGLLFCGQSAQAGCIGPVIMGECTGQAVPWDTHQDAVEVQRPSPPPGWHIDRRGNPEHERHSDPQTGHDPHDPHWLDPTWR